MKHNPFESGAKHEQEQTVDDMDLGPSIKEQLKVFREKLPVIESANPLSLDDICEREGVQIQELENHLKEQAQGFADEMKDACSWGDDQYRPMIENWYNLFLISQQDQKGDLDWISSFKSFEDFIEHFCPEANNHSKSYIKKNVQDFIEKKIHPQRTIAGWEFNRYQMRDEEFKLYQAVGDWVLIPDSYSSEYTDVVAKQVVFEIIELIENGYPQTEYAHASSSTALDGIGRAKAILSARESVKRDIDIKSGEFHHYWNQEVSEVKKEPNRISVLGSVYSNRGLPHYGYHSLNWFDDYFVGFGIDRQKQEEFLAANDYYYGDGDQKELSVDYGGEGIIIGPQVPLDNVEIVYAWKQYEEQTRKWIEQNCPHAKFISLEAIEVLKGHSDIVNKMALQENVTPTEAWKSLIKE